MSLTQLIVLASNNQGKLKELTATLSPLNVTLQAQSEYEIEDVPETGLGFVENALIKARHAAKISKKPAIADDSGLVVAALNGAPGIYSARYSGEKATDTKNNAFLLENMADIDNRHASFYCALVFVEHELDPSPLIAVGKFHGEILISPKGNHGFGYDPLFYVPEYQLTAAEMPKELKNKISHRAIASKKLLALLKEEYNHG